MKKKDKVLIGIIGTLGLGALAYYIMKKSTGQPSSQPSPSPSPPPQTSPTICQITGCNKLIVFYNNKTYSNQGVNVGWGSPASKVIDPLDTIKYIHYPAGSSKANEQCIPSNKITVYKNMWIFDSKLYGTATCDNGYTFTFWIEPDAPDPSYTGC